MDELVKALLALAVGAGAWPVPPWTRDAPGASPGRAYAEREAGAASDRAPPEHAAADDPRARTPVAVVGCRACAS